MNQPNEPLHIVQLTIENVKRIRAVSITPAVDVVVLSGRNMQGKTSVLDAIWLALGGGQAKRDTKVTSPIRHGEETASAYLDLGELQVTRTWKQGDDGEVTTSLKVESQGNTLGSPQAVLDRLIGQTGFDPLAFTRMSDREQVAELASRVELPFDPDQFDEQTKRLELTRTDFDRDLKTLRAQVEGMPRYPNGPTEQVSITEAMDAYTTAELWWRDREQLAQKVMRLNERFGILRNRVTELEAELAAVKAEAEQVGLESTEGLKSLASVYDSANGPDLDALREQVESLGERNAQAQQNARYEFAQKELAGKIAESEGRTAAIEARRQEKRDALAAATFPVPDLGFDDGVVTYKGLPFKQASGAEQVEISTAIAMAGNPRLRVVTIRDASLLDAAHMAIIEKMAAKNGFQLWLERVDDSGSVGVVIEDGEVAK